MSAPPPLGSPTPPRPSIFRQAQGTASSGTGGVMKGCALVLLLRGFVILARFDPSTDSGTAGSPTGLRDQAQSPRGSGGVGARRGEIPVVHRFETVLAWFFSPLLPGRERAKACPGRDPGVRGKMNVPPLLVCRREEKGFRWIPACAGMTKVKMFGPRKSRTDILPKFLIDPHLAVVASSGQPCSSGGFWDRQKGHWLYTTGW